MRVLITGAGGQLGRELVRSAPASAVVLAKERSDLDIADAAAIQDTVQRFRPSLIVNAAAYTAVDKAEADSAQARLVNTLAPGLLANAARSIGNCRLIHFSTDYVFSGDSSIPYRPDSPTQPLGVYGQSKLAGEQAVLQTLAAYAVVLRTAWVYGQRGANFLLTMLRLLRERGTVRVVADQIGCPTATRSLAEITWACAACPELNGIHHWSDAGVASWYDFAVAIAEEAQARGLLGPDTMVQPIMTEDYPTAARRPRFSLLDGRGTSAALGIAPLHWRVRLRQVLDEMAHV